MPFPISIAHQCKLLFLQLGPSYIKLFLSPSSSFWKSQLPAASQLQSFLQTSADQL
jgi:hypothetical protein